MPDQHRDNGKTNLDGLGQFSSRGLEFSKDFLEKTCQEHGDKGVVSAHDCASLGELGDLKISSPIKAKSRSREDQARIKSATNRLSHKLFARKLKDNLRSNLRSLANDVLGSEAADLSAKAGRTECLDFLKALEIDPKSSYFPKAKQLREAICRLMIRQSSSS